MAWSPPAWDDYIAGFSPPGMTPSQEAPVGAAPAAPLTPEEEQQIEIDQPPQAVAPSIEMPEEFVGRQGPYIGRPTRIIEMPEEFAGSYGEPDAISGADPRAGVADMVGGVSYEQPGAGLLTPPLLGQPAPQPQAPSKPIAKQAGDAVARAAGVATGAVADAAAKVAPDTRAPGEMPDEYLSGDELADKLHQRSPEEQAKFLSDLKKTEDNFMAAKTLEASEANLKRVEDNARARQAARAAADERRAKRAAEAQQLADQDPTDTIPGYQKLAGVLAALVGGFAANKTGRNMGLEVVNQIADDAARQHAQRIQLKTRQAEDEHRSAVEGADDAFQGAEAARLAVYDVAAKKIQTDLLSLDPRGSQARERLQMLNELAAARAKADQQAHQQDIENQTKLAELANKRMEFANKSADFDLKQRKYAAMGAGGGAKPEKPAAFDKTPRTVADLRRLGVKLPTDVKLPDDALLSLNDVADLSVAGKKAEDWTKAARENSPAERTRELTVSAPPRIKFGEKGEPLVDRNTGNLKQADGTDWVIPTVPEAQAFRKKKAAADAIIQNLDEMVAIRNRVGGESSWGNSDDYQRLQVLKQNIVKIAKAGTEGMSSDADMARLEQAAGADSPASFRAQAAKLEEGRRQVEMQLNTDARSIGYTGDDIRYADPSKKTKVKVTPRQNLVKDIMTFDPRGVIGTNEKFKRLISDPSDDAEIPARYMREIDYLVATYTDPEATDKERSSARRDLNNLRSNASSSLIRDYVTTAGWMVPGDEVRD